MSRYLLALLLCSFIVTAAWSQDPELETSDPDESQPGDEVAEPDDSDLDEQEYLDEDDDFRPSDEISTDQSIAFPTDI